MYIYNYQICIVYNKHQIGYWIHTGHNIQCIYYDVCCILYMHVPIINISLFGHTGEAQQLLNTSFLKQF